MQFKKDERFYRRRFIFVSTCSVDAKVLQENFDILKISRNWSTDEYLTSSMKQSDLHFSDAMKEFFGGNQQSVKSRLSKVNPFPCTLKSQINFLLGFKACRFYSVEFCLMIELLKFSINPHFLNYIKIGSALYFTKQHFLS